MPTKTPGLDEFRLFIKVAEAGNISQAAAAVGLTQPSVSRAMRALEQGLQTELFHRTGRGVVLTPTGEQALERARVLVLSADQFVSGNQGTGAGTHRRGDGRAADRVHGEDQCAAL